MFKIFVFILIFSVCQILQDQCCERKIVNGIEYHLRETNDATMIEFGCQDNCIYEQTKRSKFCFKEGNFSTQCIAPGLDTVEKGSTNITLRDEGHGFFCNLDFHFTLNKTFQVVSDPFTSCAPASVQDDSLRFMEEKLFKITSKTGVVLDCKLIPIFSSDETGSIQFSESAVRRTLNCTVSTDVCLTNNGPVYPAKCVPTFRFKDREYHACTDQGLLGDDDRLWCATEVDKDLNLVDGSWGYCSSLCSYCGGSPVNDERSFYQPCGYDCLVNTGKQMKGSLGSRNVPLLSPTAALYGGQKDNFIKDVYGQIQLNSGEQLVMVTCPDSKFFDPDLKGFQTIFVRCGPKQYRFTVYAENGDLLHEEFKNDRFGCDPCPNQYNYVNGYKSTTNENRIGSSYNVPDADSCEDICFNSRLCKSFTHSRKYQECNIFSNANVEPTYSNYEDFSVCSKEPGCCSRIRISSTGGTSQFQSTRLGIFVRNGRHNNRDFYKQETGSKILFYSGYREYGWVVGSGFESLGGLRSKSSINSLCPGEIISWEYYSGSSWIEDDSVIIYCTGNDELTSRFGSRSKLEDAMNSLAVNWVDYQNQRIIYQKIAYILLLESVRLENDYKASISSSDKPLLFSNNILAPSSTEEFMWFAPDCLAIQKGEVIDEIPTSTNERLRKVVHTIGYFIRLYGDETIEETNAFGRKLLRVDNVLYEIGVRRRSKEETNLQIVRNLYIAPLACYYTKNKDIWVKKLTEKQCDSMLKIHQKDKDQPHVLDYPDFDKITSIEIVFAALSKLFMGEYNLGTEIEDFHLAYYYNKVDPGQMYQAFIAETYAMAIFAEVVRNIEMLPATLALIQMYNSNPNIEMFKSKDLQDIHPMTQPNTFRATNSLKYELSRGGVMNYLGFFPIHEEPKDFYLQNKEQFIGDQMRKFDLKVLDGTLNIHNKALAIFQLYEEIFPGDPTLVVSHFFRTSEPNSATNGLPIPNIFQILFVFKGDEGWDMGWTMLGHEE